MLWSLLLFSELVFFCFGLYLLVLRGYSWLLLSSDLDDAQETMCGARDLYGVCSASTCIISSTLYFFPPRVILG